MIRKFRFPIILFLVLSIAYLSMTAMAGRNQRTISIFPHIHKTIYIPYVQGVDGEQCTANIEIGNCYGEISGEDIEILLMEGCEIKEIPSGPLSMGNDYIIKCPGHPEFWDIFTVGDLVIGDEDVQCQPTSVEISCPEGAVIIDPEGTAIDVEELVETAWIGDTIHVRGSMFSKSGDIIGYVFQVWYVFPNKTKRLIYKTDRQEVHVASTYTDEFSYTFDRLGIHKFALKVFKPDGRIGRVVAKVIVLEPEMDLK